MKKHGPLKLWNGRGWDSAWLSGKKRNLKGVEHWCGAAHSQKDMVELLKRAGHRLMSLSELKNYSSPCWGNEMNEIPAVRGVWVRRFDRTLKRVV